MQTLLHAGRPLSGYVPPRREAMKISLLDKSSERVKKELQHNVTDHWVETGVTIVTDGWKDIQGRPLFNFLPQCPYGAVFL